MEVTKIENGVGVPAGHEPPWWLHACLFTLVMVLALGAGMAQYFLTTTAEAEQPNPSPSTVQKTLPHR